MKRIPRWMRIAGKASVSLAVLGFLARNLSGAELVAIVRSLDATLLVVGLAQMLLIPVLGGVRWKLILKALNERQSLGSLISIFWGGMALNQVLPTAVGGDVVRVWLAIRRGVAVANAVTSVLLDRVLMLIALVAMAALAGLAGEYGTIPAWQLMLCGIVLAGIVAGFASLPLILRLLKLLPQRRIIAVVVAVAEGILRVMRDRRAPLLVILCLATNLNLSLSAWWLARAMDLAVSFTGVLLAVTLGFVSAIAPISVGGWGVREAATVAVLAALDVPNDRALLFSITFGLAVTAASLPGIAWLWRGGRLVPRASPPGARADSPVDRAESLQPVGPIDA